MWLGLNSILRFSIELRPTKVYCPFPFFWFCLRNLKSFVVIFWNVLRIFFLHNSNFPCWLWWAMPDRYVKNFCQQGRNYVNHVGNRGTSHTKWMQRYSEFWKFLILKFFLIDEREQEMSTALCNWWDGIFAEGPACSGCFGCSACSALKTANCNLPSWQDGSLWRPCMIKTWMQMNLSHINLCTHHSWSWMKRL